MPKIIAHRGGVVGDDHAENSPAAVDAAVARGYWMIEVDVRETRDGKLLVHHDPDFTRFYGDPRQASDLTWAEIAELRATPGDTRPLQFHELAALAKGRIRLMLDTKPKAQSDAYVEAIFESLRDNDLLDTAYVINPQHPSPWIAAGIRVGATSAELAAAAADGQDVAGGYFLFEHGRDLTTEQVKAAQNQDIPVVPSVNIYHYADLDDHAAAASVDIHRMLDLGVEHFQIDSPYDVWLR